MKLTKSKLKRIIKEELEAIQEESLEEEHKVVQEEDLSDLEEVGGHGSPEGREASDADYAAAVDTLKDLVNQGFKTADDIMRALRGGEEGPFHPRPSRGRTGVYDEPPAE